MLAMVFTSPDFNADQELVGVFPSVFLQPVIGVGRSALGRKRGF